jgi:hypothetical protein
MAHDTVQGVMGRASRWGVIRTPNITKLSQIQVERELDELRDLEERRVVKRQSVVGVLFSAVPLPLFPLILPTPRCSGFLADELLVALVALLLLEARAGAAAAGEAADAVGEALELDDEDAGEAVEGPAVEGGGVYGVDSGGRGGGGRGSG